MFALKVSSAKLLCIVKRSKMKGTLFIGFRATLNFQNFKMTLNPLY